MVSLRGTGGHGGGRDSLQVEDTMEGGVSHQKGGCPPGDRAAGAEEGENLRLHPRAQRKSSGVSVQPRDFHL